MYFSSNITEVSFKFVIWLNETISDFPQGLGQCAIVVDIVMTCHVTSTVEQDIIATFLTQKKEGKNKTKNNTAPLRIIY